MDPFTAARFWKLSKHWFTPDGSLRDISVSETTLADWEKLYAFLRQFYECRYFQDSKPTTPPARVETAFETNRNQAQVVLQFDLPEAITVNCHFFDPSLVEMDVTPEEIKSAEALSALLELMRTMGELLHKEVVLFLEGMPEQVIFRYQADSGQLAYADNTPWWV